jgi:chlorobactene glucosyltransferase
MANMVLFWLLLFSVIYLIFTSFILIRNRKDLTVLAPASRKKNTTKKISVCIPARNEENNIATLLQSLVGQTYSDYEIHVLDDHSKDQTAQIVSNYVNSHPQNITLHSGKAKPGSWLGKPWACRQLADYANGDILLFVDADTSLKSDTLQRIANSFEKYNVDMCTVWPRQILGSPMENIVLPLIYYALVTLLPAIYVYRDPKWLPKPFKSKMRPAFAAANGQCIAITKEAYVKTSGHEAVKNKIVEDVELAKIVKEKGFTLRMFNGVDSVSCRMYRNSNEMFSGLRKNFFAGFNYSMPKFVLAALVHAIVFILPFLSFIYSLFEGSSVILFFSVISIFIILLHRLWISQWFAWNPLYAFTHPVGVAWFQKLGIVKIIDHLFQRKTDWKGRKV